MTLGIRIGVDWLQDDSVTDIGALAQLLEALARTGTVRGAAEEIELSYRTVWGRLEAAEQALGQQLVVRSKGHGSALAPAGEQLMHLVADLTQSIKLRAEREKDSFEERFQSVFSPEMAKLKLACCYDMLVEECDRNGVLAGWDIRFMGGKKAVEALRTGNADLAGFHVADDAARNTLLDGLRADPHYFVSTLMRREQGLVVAQGNPLQIEDVEDLLRPDVRFINRQKSAGTRSWLDRLLAARGLDPKAIRGYGQEEFTHSAIALSVAAGAADAGLALRAATRGLAVDFIALGFDTFYLCGNLELAKSQHFAQLQSAIQTALAQLPGYSAVATA